MPAVDTAIRQGDCIQLMREMPAGSIDLAFADPPFNIGYEYDTYHDEQEDDEYLTWSRQWMEEIHRLLTPEGSFWLAIGDEYAADLKVIADRQIGFSTRSWVVWYYTFGVNCKRKFSRSHVHIFHFVKDPDRFTFNADDPAVRIPSARALVYGDKRANPNGRLPDDTWILRPQDFQSDRYGFDAMDDTWYFARVAGTFKERQGFHGCQMPEQLLGRIIRVSSNPGDMVFDPFTGSGTTLAVAKKLGRKFSGTELSEEYVRYASERLESVKEHDTLDGPADAIASAPNTANGRRLKGQPLLPTFQNADFTPPEPAPEQLPEEPEPVEPQATVAEVSPAAEPAPEEPPAPTGPVKINLRKIQRTAVGKAFLAASSGQSVDRLLASPELQAAFHEQCQQSGLLGNGEIWNHELVRLRKSGKLPKQPRAKTTPVTAAELDQYQFAAEIAWQLTSEKFGIESIDEIFISPEQAAWFDRQAARFAPGFDAANYRWAAIDFRKSRHALAEEAKAYDYVFATRDFPSIRKPTVRTAAKFDGQAGVYLLTGKGRTPLFVGEALDLGARIATHVIAPGTKSKVTGFAVILEDELPSSEYRAPLKVDLTKRYEPEWNLK
ncbi:site-specific DNA-methyltransferase [Aeoliella sp. ICT_H6.2]|uniref:Site-specific DNA-methyltransferase n=1 Tax=Aeoliella straminimaris TaxID=2954799 RepID=A0A9X2FE00_9BACT|nr:DNA methyltransferase [Aeoliella straminimaris]MCO6046473.1 site-specific DNA-methyltransferase [Aeoliella straminimaris]